MHQSLLLVVISLLFGTNLSFGQTGEISSQSVSQIKFEGVNAGDRRELVPGIAFRWCPAGEFKMGTPGATNKEQPADVTLSSGFWLAETEITQRQWYQVMVTRPWKGQTNFRGGVDCPATYISHTDAVQFCQKLTARERTSHRLPDVWKYSLPTEAQWEYACRAGTATTFSFGDDESRLNEYAWYLATAGDVGEAYVHQVGLKQPNHWGLMDMHGNAYEWCSDWYGDILSGGRDPQGPSSGLRRVNRGGSWSSGAVGCRTANRGGSAPTQRDYDVSFRLAAIPN